MFDSFETSCSNSFDSGTPRLGLLHAPRHDRGGYGCALKGNDSVWCWGDSDTGQLGDGKTIPSSAQPVRVSGVSGARSLALGDDHACALLGGGTAECWGRDDDGQLGDGTKPGTLLP